MATTFFRKVWPPEEAAFCLYEDEEGRQFWARHREDRPAGRPPCHIKLTGAEAEAIAKYMNDKQLAMPDPARRSVYFLNSSGVVSETSPTNIMSQLRRRFVFCEVYTMESLTAFGPNRSGAMEDGPLERLLTQTFEHTRTADDNRLGLVRPPDFRGPRVHEAFLSGELTPYGGTYGWPLVGALDLEEVHCRVAPAPSELPTSYPHLRALAATYPLDPISRSHFYGYLLGCFHASSATRPIPILAIDSWCQAMGKSDLSAAIYTILEGRDPSSITVETRTPMGDALSSHFSNGAKVACLDNLTNFKSWAAEWLCTLASSRRASYRVRYRASSTDFIGCYVVLNLVFGDSTLSEDIIARTWRVAVQGTRDYWNRFPHNENPRRAHEYARANRDALVAECYAAVHRTQGARPDLPEKLSSRCRGFLNIAAAAYEEVFGEPFQCDVGGVQANMLSSDAIKLLRAGDVAFLSDGVHSRLNPMRPAQLGRFVGGRALGYVIDSDGKPQKEDVSQWYPNP